MHINYMDFMSALTLMGQGMLGIFVVMLIITLLITLFTRFTK